MPQAESPTNNRQPKSTIAHSLDFGEVLQQFQGVNNMNEEFDKDFLLCEGVHKIIPKIISARNKGELTPRFGYKKDKEEEVVNLDMNIVRRMNMIWYGHVKFVVQRYPNKTQKVKWRTIWYDKMPPAPGREIMVYPALRSMNPIDGKSDPTWGIRISEAVLIPHALARCDPQQVVLEGHFYKKFANKIVPYFNTPTDIHQSKGMTYVVSRNYFNVTIQNLIMFWLKNYAEIYIDIHKIIKFLRLGDLDDLESFEEKSSFKMMSELK